MSTDVYRGNSGDLKAHESSERSRKIKDQKPPLLQQRVDLMVSSRQASHIQPWPSWPWPQDKLAKYAFYGTTLVVGASGHARSGRSGRSSLADLKKTTEAFIITCFLTTFLRIEGMFTDFCHLAEAQLGGIENIKKIKNHQDRYG